VKHWRSQAELRRSVAPGFALGATPRSPLAIPPRASARSILAKASEALRTLCVDKECVCPPRAGLLFQRGREDNSDLSYRKKRMPHGIIRVKLKTNGKQEIEPGK
jgi:hypothetical protein